MSGPRDVLVIRTEHGIALEPIAHPDGLSDERYQHRLDAQTAHRTAELQAHDINGEVIAIAVDASDPAAYLSAVQAALGTDMPVAIEEPPFYQVRN